ncbi:MAG: NUDIX hydrolase [Acetobacteraceae bacterium]
MDQTEGKRRIVRPRDAAGMIVLRERGSAVEVLLGVRAGTHRFMPNRLAFPGGSVERRDYSATAASTLAPATEAMLDKAARPGLANALAMAAARELAEETGLSLGKPPALAGLFYLCRAITPADLPIRFHARFLVIPAATLDGRLGGSGELEGLGFYGLDDPALAALPWITARVLSELATWLRLPPAMRTGIRRTAVYRNRVRREE